MSIMIPGGGKKHFFFFFKLLICSSDPQPVVHMVSSREQDWTEQEVAMESVPTIIYPEVTGSDIQSAASTIKALLELQQTTGECLCHGKATGGKLKEKEGGLYLVC